MLTRMTLTQLERIQREPRQAKSVYNYPGNIKARAGTAKNRNHYTSSFLEDKAFNDSYQKHRLTFKKDLMDDLA